MSDVLQRMLWFAAVASVAAYATYLITGSVAEAWAATSPAPVLVRDELSAGSHQLSGMVMVPSSCYQLSVGAKQLFESRYELAFETWKDPAVPCSEDEVPRSFHLRLVAPAAGIEFVASIDGKAFPIGVLPTISGQFASP